MRIMTKISLLYSNKMPRRRLLVCCTVSRNRLTQALLRVVSYLALLLSAGSVFTTCADPSQSEKLYLHLTTIYMT